MKNHLISILKENNITDKVIDLVIESGYISLDGKRIIDQMYGTKQFSSCFETDKFISYLKGEYKFEKMLPYAKFSTYRVKNIEDIRNVLEDPRRSHYIQEGTFSYRGQIEEYFFQRSIPNPFRKNKQSKELSILPGLYRQTDNLYSFFKKIKEDLLLLDKFNMLDPDLNSINSSYSMDAMRVEQHYGNQTGGLDLSFDIETAIFFATYKFITINGIAKYVKIPKGEHKGVIYCFRFTSPTVKKTEYLIKDFDVCKKYIPERILRQQCGLPLLGSHERNISICDINSIIYLDNDFDYEGLRIPEYMFPNEKQDMFYAQLMKFKKTHPILFSEIPEYVHF